MRHEQLLQDSLCRALLMLAEAESSAKTFLNSLAALKTAAVEQEFARRATRLGDLCALMEGDAAFTPEEMATRMRLAAIKTWRHPDPANMAATSDGTYLGGAQALRVGMAFLSLPALQMLEDMDETQLRSPKQRAARAYLMRFADSDGICLTTEKYFDQLTGHADALSQEAKGLLRVVQVSYTFNDIITPGFISNRIIEE